ncbi:MAG TPA: molybdopterin-binding protein [Planctomycetota bacterium]|nr:molybdopterin-binding protein [Planctomycetota bacterium]
MARAEVVVIGAEVLTGKVTDANGPFLCAELRALGAELRRLTVVPDELEAIAETVRAASARVDFVITTGGVGPTLDDLTFEAVAAAFGVGRRRDARLVDVLRAFFGDAVVEAHLRMADLPEGAELLFSDGLRFPVVKVRNVYVMPGSPGILRKKWIALRERFREAPFVLRRVFVTLEEGLLAPTLEAVRDAEPDVTLGSYPVFDDPAYAVQVTLEAKDAAAVERATRRLLERLDPRTVVRVA